MRGEGGRLKERDVGRGREKHDANEVSLIEGFDGRKGRKGGREGGREGGKEEGKEEG